MGRNGKITDVNEIAEYLFEQFQSDACEKNPVTVKRVAKHCKITPRQLGRIFEKKWHVNLSPKKYIQLLQLIFIRVHLFLNPDLPLKHLQALVGIRSRATFEKLFKDFFGTTAKKHFGKPHPYTQLRALFKEFGMSDI